MEIRIYYSPTQTQSLMKEKKNAEIKSWISTYTVNAEHSCIDICQKYRLSLICELVSSDSELCSQLGV